MAGPGGLRKRIVRITGKLRPGRRTARRPSNLGIDLNQGAIKPPSVPIGARLNRAKQGIKKNIGRSVDGVKNNSQRTLGAPEEEKLRAEQGIPPKNPEENIPGGKAKIANKEDSDDQEEKNAEEDMAKEESSEDELAAQQNRSLPRTEQASPSVKEPDNRGNSLEEGGPNIQKAFPNRAIDFLKKKFGTATTKVISFFNKRIWLYVIAIILILLLGFLLFNYLWGSANKKVSEDGQTMTQVYDPARDRPTLQAVLQMSGDKDIQQLASWTFIQNLQKELTSMQNDAGLATRPDKAEIAGKIDTILGDIQSYSASKDNKTGKKIINGIKELWEMFGTLPLLADAGSPLPKDSIVGYTNNLHDGTPMNPCTKGSCPKGHRTFYQSERNTCDAADLKAKNGTEIIAAFPGTVKKIGSDGRNHSVIYIENNQGYLAVYAHIANPTVKLNDLITTGQKLGTIYLGHLHFELAKNGKCVTSTSQDVIDAKKNKRPPGYYLWLRMAKVLNNAV